MKRKIRVVILVILILLVCGCGWYCLSYSPVVDRDAAMCETERVSVIGTEFGYFYDGPGEENALVFYPGAKVDESAYARLLKILADGGIDCFVVKMPIHMAFTNIDGIEDVWSEYSYTHWYLGGHSLGGAMAAQYASEHSEELSGLIFLAAYSAKDLTETGLPVLSIYGSEDGVLNRENLVEGRMLVDQNLYTEVEIPGGNHAQFGDYGLQSGDGTASIDAETQRSLTAEAIFSWIP